MFFFAITSAIEKGVVRRQHEVFFYLYYRLSFTNTGLDIWYYTLTIFKWETISLTGMLTKLLLWGTDISVYKILMFFETMKGIQVLRDEKKRFCLSGISQCRLDKKIKKYSKK